MAEAGGQSSTRRSAGEIFAAAVKNARDELDRSSRALAFSGVTGGLTMGLTGLAVASVHAAIGQGGWSDLVSFFFYPIGFIAVIIGRGKLFTENTLYPVILVLDERSARDFRNTARLWGVVFVSNVAGALAFAALAIRTGALNAEIATGLIELGKEAVSRPAAQVFWSGLSADGSSRSLPGWSLPAIGQLPRSLRPGCSRSWLALPISRTVSQPAAKFSRLSFTAMLRSAPMPTGCCWQRWATLSAASLSLAF